MEHKMNPAAVKTIDLIKQKRSVPDALRKRRKEFDEIKKAIKKALKEGPKTIPEISKITGIDPQAITFNLMTLRKFNVLEPGDIDDMDEYYYYRLIKK
jgi:predicted transcriptional regulator